MQTTLCQQQAWRSSLGTHSGSRGTRVQQPALAPTGRRQLGQLAGHHRQQQQQQQRLEPCNVWPLDQAWGPAVDLDTMWDTLPQNLFAVSIIPYAGFLYHLHRSKQTPPLTLFGFYFLLVFVFATIPAGIYAKNAYSTSLANVDWLHGSAEFLLTLTNLFIVLGLRDAIRKAEATNAANAAAKAGTSAKAATAGGNDNGATPEPQPAAVSKE